MSVRLPQQRKPPAKRLFTGMAGSPLSKTVMDKSTQMPEPAPAFAPKPPVYMGVSPWFVELKVRSGELPALKLCRHYTILREDMDDFLEAERKKAVSPASLSLAIQ